MTRDSFVFHFENLDDLEGLDDHEIVTIFKAIVYYQQTGKEPEFEDRTLSAVWKPIRRRLVIDNEHYEERCRINRENGAKGGRPRKEETEKTERLPKKPNGFSENRTQPKKPDTDTDIDIDTEYDTETDNDLKNKRKPAKAGKRKDHFYPQDEKLNKAFCDYVQMRKGIKKPMTDRAIELAIKELDKLSHGDPDVAIAILEQSILHSWSGLFTLRKPRARSGTDWDALMADIERREAAAT